MAGGAGGPALATNVSLASPGGFACGVSFAAGDLYVGSAYALRQVNPRTDWLTTPVGTSVKGPLNDTKRAVRASVEFTCRAAVDAAGNLVITDTNHNRIRLVQG